VGRAHKSVRLRQTVRSCNSMSAIRPLDSQLLRHCSLRVEVLYFSFNTDIKCGNFPAEFGCKNGITSFTLGRKSIVPASSFSNCSFKIVIRLFAKANSSLLYRSFHRQANGHSWFCLICGLLNDSVIRSYLISCRLQVIPSEILNPRKAPQQIRSRELMKRQ